MNLMIFSNIPLRLFVIILFTFLFNLPKSYSQSIPKPIAKPHISKKKYQEVFEQVKKQNWVMAKALADEYNNPSLSTYIEWLDITRPGSEHKFEYLVNFYDKNKNWPSLNIIKKKIEISIDRSTDKKKIVSWFSKNPPISSKGEIEYFEAKQNLGILKEKSEIIKKIWINKNLTYNQQKYFINRYKKFWKFEDNWARFDRLMWEGKLVSARRTLSRIKGPYRRLGNARLALSKRAGNVSSLIKLVPIKLQNDPGLIYERMRWRRKAKLNTAVDFLFNPPDRIVNYRKWWINARIVIRRLINKKDYVTAYKALQNHKIPLDTKSGYEAEWLAGWVALNFKNSPKKALNHFQKIYESSNSEYIKSNAAFWIAKSYEKTKNIKSNEWYKISSKNLKSFYGQNSYEKLNKKFLTTVNKTNLSNLSKSKDIKHLFEILEILKVSGEVRRSFPLLEKAIEISSTQNERNFVLDYASKLQNKKFLIMLGKNINHVPIKYSHPTITSFVPYNLRKDKSFLALIHSIIRQESAFSVNAQSHAGARGLMQLMPFTAKRVAKSLKVRYYKSALTKNPQYNITLGTKYIKDMLERYDGSLPLALAAYNAGPGRVKIWLKRYGDPRKKEISFINWIESVPIYETRNYIKKVIENYRIYKNVFDVKVNKFDVLT